MDTIPASIPKPVEEIEEDTIVVGDENNAKSSVVVLGKKVYAFVIYNTETKQDDVFEFQVSVLPRDTEEQTYKQARFKALGFVKTRPCYNGEKLRNKGEPRA